MQFQPSSIVWMAVLGGCRVYNNLFLAIHAAENVFELEPENSALYVLLSNVCGMLLDLEDNRESEEKNSQCSYMSTGSRGYNFLDDKLSFELNAIIHAKLNRLYGRLEMVVPL